MNRLADLTSPAVPARPLVLVPVGSTEQHGPHLPIDTDTAIATAVAERAADLLGDDAAGVLVAPAVSYGSSGEHQSFPGTASVGTEALTATLVELARSLGTWAGEVVLVNAHGGNVEAMNAAVALLVGEGRRVSWVPCATETLDLHAGHTETSLMLHLRPASVRMDRAAAGDTRPLAEILPLMRAGGVAAVSATGVLGDPRRAEAGHGIEVLEAMAADVVRRVRAAVRVPGDDL